VMTEQGRMSPSREGEILLRRTFFFVLEKVFYSGCFIQRSACTRSQTSGLILYVNACIQANLVPAERKKWKKFLK
jgi:hypothetical protein